MHPSRSRSSCTTPLLGLLVATVLVGCSSDSAGPTTPTIESVRVSAPGGKGGGGGNITITATNPGELPRGVVGVDLAISGSGFEPGSDVAFEIDGTATTGVTTNRVTYVDESTLIANVDVALDAVETLYDVAVRNGPKKKGVGVDLLKVTESDVTPVIQPQVLSTEFSGSQEIFQISGEWMVGSDEDFLCDFVYNITTDTKDCISIPWADPTDDMAALLMGATPEGVVVGIAKDASGEPIPFRIDYVNDPTTILRLERPAGWSNVAIAWDDPINAQGLILGSAHREVPSLKGPKHRTQYESIAIIWRPDGTIHSMSAPGDGNGSLTGAFSDVLPDGSLLVGVSPARLWDGVDGSAPMDLDVQSLAEPYVSVIGPSGEIYGTDRGRVIRWSTPTAPAEVLVNLGAQQGLGLWAVDEHGNLLGRGDYNDGIFGVCIDLTDPLRGITRLAGWAPFTMGTAPLGGREGRIFGHPSQRISYWDLTGVEGGCSSG